MKKRKKIKLLKKWMNAIAEVNRLYFMMDVVMSVKANVPDEVIAHNIDKDGNDTTYEPQDIHSMAKFSMYQDDISLLDCYQILLQQGKITLKDFFDLYSNLKPFGGGNRSNTMDNIPRRNQLDKCTPAELAIYKALQEVEKAGSDVRLTNAAIKLIEARDLVGDFVDGVTKPVPGFVERDVDERTEDELKLKSLDFAKGLPVSQDGDSLVKNAKEIYDWLKEKA